MRTYMRADIDFLLINPSYMKLNGKLQYYFIIQSNIYTIYV